MTFSFITCTTAVAVAWRRAWHSVHLVKRSCNTSKYAKPLRLLGNGPIKSIETCSHGQSTGLTLLDITAYLTEHTRPIITVSGSCNTLGLCLNASFTAWNAASCSGPQNHLWFFLANCTKGAKTTDILHFFDQIIVSRRKDIASPTPSKFKPHLRTFSHTAIVVSLCVGSVVGGVGDVGREKQF
ncbi:hypothetical protein QE152_g8820 [Popillia japonica]|uniref:Secreted protein n=1 Tax=Popillia japonica TaxID=7064 RepID=A0AAW1M2B2_POPJA